jgi:hypothetical protein
VVLSLSCLAVLEVTTVKVREISEYNQDTSGMMRMHFLVLKARKDWMY